ncbi:phytase [Oryzibacter oryziterrae]|uniref:phytase n=1 Tax=Oryzibacter oryziterrae TaxID=2766474 RepID=UPI001F0264B9|nr:phytase [Oryzibacter oryziterrae]
MTLRRLVAVASFSLTLVSWHTLALATPSIAEVAASVETPNLSEEDGKADADDPSFWVDPADPAKTLVITAIKNGGIRVYDLKGTEVQKIKAEKTDAGKGRINNIDVVYGLKLADGSSIDVAVASDRGLDIIRVFKIDGSADKPLSEITDLSVGRAFPTRPDKAGGADQDNPLDDQMTVYGLTAWKAADGKVLAVGTQRTNPRVGVFELQPEADGKVAVKMVHDARVPFVFDGQDLTAESKDDPLSDWNPQFEGVTVDKVTGAVYAGQEDVGIWKLDPATGLFGDKPLYTTRGSSKSVFNKPDSVITRDVEGLTVYYGKTARYLLASSQGGAHGEGGVADAPYDDSFAVFRIDDGFKLLGSFRVAANAAAKIDAVQESDGADVIATALPGWPNGLFVTQDGYNDDLNGLSGEPKATNFKFVDWAAIANAFNPPLEINAGGYDPRK